MRRMSRSDRRHWYIDPVPQYYGWDGEWRYFGRPGFGGGRYNGGSFGPCWTRTPIGAGLELRLREAANDFDQADDRGIEGVEVFGRNPVLKV